MLHKLIDFFVPQSLLIQEDDFEKAVWKWKLRSVIFLLFVFIATSFYAYLFNIEMLSPNSGIGTSVIHFLYLLYIKRFGDNKRNIIPVFFLLTFINALGISLQGGFSLFVMRIPVSVITATIQFGKKTGVITFIFYVLVLFYIQDYHPEVMTEQLYLLDDLATLQFATRLKNSALLQSLAILSVSFYNETVLEQSVKTMENTNQRLRSALRAKTEFLARCSHELRTPLNGIMGSADILMSGELNDEQYKFLHIIRDCSSTLTALINDILDFSNIEIEQLKLNIDKVNLFSLVKSVYEPISLLASAKGLETSCILHRNVPEYLQTDEIRLKQVITNLLSNSVKFTAMGKISFEIDFVPENKIKIAISDTGTGVAIDKQEIIFDAFRQADDTITRKFGGNGLGLAICKSIVEKMGGSIHVESDGKNGSLFYFYIPYIPVKLHTTREVRKGSIDLTLLPENLRKRTRFSRNQKILVVEDNILNQKVIIKMLQKLNCNIEVANNGNEAVEIAKKEQFPLIFMDLEMPVMDGKTATKVLRLMPQYRHIPIIAFTAHVLGSTEKDKMAQEFGFSSFLMKPATLSDLRDVIDKM